MDLTSSWSPPKKLYPSMHEWYMDRRHVAAIRAELATKQYGRVLEIGCYHGYSTCAFLDALLHGEVQEVHLCDPMLSAKLHKAVDHYGFHVEYRKQRSVDLLLTDTDWDLVLVDGDHSQKNVLAEAEALLGVQAVFAHDTRYADGPKMLMEKFVAAGYKCEEDCEFREGERTERGLCFLRC